MAEDPRTAPILKEMGDEDGKPRVCQRVWISSIGCLGDAYSDLGEQKGKLTTGFGASPEEFGPEFTFGISMEKLLGEPILILKTSWGGRSLHTDFRPPGAGPYAWSDYELAQCKRRGDDLEKIKADKVKDTGLFYHHMIEHVRKVLTDIKRVVPESIRCRATNWPVSSGSRGLTISSPTGRTTSRWRPAAYDLYGVNCWRSHPRCPQGPVGAEDALRDRSHGDRWCPGREEGTAHVFRQAQAYAGASLPEFKGNVVAVPTVPFGTTIWPCCTSGWRNRGRKWMKRPRNTRSTPAEGRGPQEGHRGDVHAGGSRNAWRASPTGGYHYSVPPRSWRRSARPRREDGEAAGYPTQK